MAAILDFQFKTTSGNIAHNTGESGICENVYNRWNFVASSFVLRDKYTSGLAPAILDLQRI